MVYVLIVLCFCMLVSGWMISNAIHRECYIREKMANEIRVMSETINEFKHALEDKDLTPGEKELRDVISPYGAVSMVGHMEQKEFNERIKMRVFNRK